MQFFEAKNICKTYDKHTALSNVSLSINEGVIYGLLGPNGAGKTTLIRIMNQIIAPDSGEVFWKNEPLKPKHANLIGYLPEERGLYKKMKVGEHGMYLAQLKGINSKLAKERLKYWFKKFEIENWWDKNVEQLSKGMQQKVQFILTVVHEPEFFIFDEPFSGFDPINSEILKQEILNFKKRGASIILSTHNMSSVEELCDEMILLNKSKTILQGKVQEIKKNFKENIFKINVSNLAEDIENLLPYTCKIIEKEQELDSTTFCIKITSGDNSNIILQRLIDKCRVNYFFEMLPSLNEIFIKSVNSNQPINLNTSNEQN